MPVTVLLIEISLNVNVRILPDALVSQQSVFLVVLNGSTVVSNGYNSAPCFHRSGVPVIRGLSLRICFLVDCDFCASRKLLVREWVYANVRIKVKAIVMSSLYCRNIHMPKVHRSGCTEIIF